MRSTKDYREILKQHYGARTARNPSYSLRAFARDLGISSSRLSEILKGKQGLSPKWAAIISEKLHLKQDEKQRFCDLVESQHSRSALRREIARERLLMADKKERLPLKEDQFKLISDWYHYAILELTALDDFQSDKTWISKRLGVHEAEISEAIDRLLRLNLLTIDKTGNFKASHGFTASSDGLPSEGVRKFHDQVIKKGLEALHESEVHERDITNIVVAVSKEDIEWAQRLIRDFRRTFSKKLAGRTVKKDSVFCLSIQYFRVDQD